MKFNKLYEKYLNENSNKYPMVIMVKDKDNKDKERHAGVVKNDEDLAKKLKSLVKDGYTAADIYGPVGPNKRKRYIGSIKDVEKVVNAV